MSTPHSFDVSAVKGFFDGSPIVCVNGSFPQAHVDGIKGMSAFLNQGHQNGNHPVQAAVLKS